MKRVLILAYYYPPNDNIPSWRPHSWAKYFSDKNTVNAEVHVVCRYWNGKERSWQDQVNPSEGEKEYIHKFSENHSVHYVRTNGRVKKVLRAGNKLGPLRKLFHLAVNMMGHFHLEVDTYFTYRNYVKKNFSKDYFDTVIVTSPPLNIIRLGYALRKHFPKAFFVADFRDLWNNEVLNEKYNPGKKESFYDNLNTKSLRKWLKAYDLVLSVSKPLTDKIEELDGFRTAVITNGYEDDLFTNLKKNGRTGFRIASIGTIYSRQEFRQLAEGIIDFVKKNNNDPAIHVDFVGVKPYNDELCEMLEKNLPSENVSITSRIDRMTALQIMKDADVLVYPGWPGYKGRYSGKIFEYLAAGNNILIAPSDNDVIHELLIETKAGVSIDTKEEVTDQLQKWFDEWKEKGMLNYTGINEKIRQYSRENQAAKLAKLIDEYRSKS